MGKAMSKFTTRWRKGKAIREIDGKVVSESEFNRRCPKPSTAIGPMTYVPAAYSDSKPGKSLSMGCHTKEIDMMNERIRKEGIVGVHYEKDKHGGKCVITNNSKTSGRRKWMKTYGEMVGMGKLHDEDSFD